MKTLVVSEVVIIAVLAIIALLLNNEHSSLQRKADSEKNYIVANQQIGLRSIAGIDVSGRFVAEMIPARGGRRVAFTLRYSTLQKDIEFWKAVDALLAKEPAKNLLDIHLVGYCDGILCAELVNNNAGTKPDFPIIAYGELMSTQAVFNADDAGNCLVTEPGIQTRNIYWRDLALTVAQMVQEIMK